MPSPKTRGVLFVLWVCSLSPTPNALGAPALQSRTIGPSDGLAHAVVYDVLPAADGKVWFATEAGLTTYDPVNARCRRITIDENAPAPKLRAMVQSSDGSIWVATANHGVGRYERNRWTWFRKGAGLQTNDLTDIGQDPQGRIWTRPSDGGLALYDGHRWRTHQGTKGLRPGPTGRCTALRSGQILCSVAGLSVLERFDGKKLHRLAVDAPTRSAFSVLDIAEANDGELWLATAGAGVIRGVSLAEGFRWKVYNHASGLPSDHAVALSVMNNVVWAATLAGVCRFEGHRFIAVQRRSTGSGGQVSAMRHDAAGRLWLGTLGSGAVFLAPSHWQTTTMEEGLASNTLTGGLLLASDGALWVGTDQGLNILRDGAWQTLQSPVVQRNHIHRLIQGPDGAIWLAHMRGVTEYRGGQWLHHNTSSSPRDPGLAATASGEIWLSTGSDVLRLKESRWQSSGRSKGLPGKQVGGIAVDKRGQLWISTDRGVARWTGQRWKVANRKTGAAEIRRDRHGDLWLSGHSGIYHLVNGDWKRWDEMHRLPGNVGLRFLQRSADRSLWFAISGSGVMRFREGHWVSYTTDDGLPAGTVRDMVELKDGTLLFATLGGGLTRLRPDRSPPHTSLVGWPNSATARPRLITGTPLMVSMWGQDPWMNTPQDQLLFTFRLDDSPWSPFENRRLIQVDDLTPGEHVLQVRAMDRDLNIDPTPAELRFSVLLPWPDRLWPRIGMAAVALLMIGGVVLVYWTRRRRLNAERRALQHETVYRRAMRHIEHELNKPLSSIVYQARRLVGSNAPKQVQPLRGTLEVFDRCSRQLEQMIGSLRILDRLHSGQQLVTTICDLAELARRVRVESSEEVSLRNRASRPLVVRGDPDYLVFAIECLIDNALKYGGGGESVNVTIEALNGQAVLTVQDRGPGIPKRERSQLFEPFVRGRYTGSHCGLGLGLPLSRTIARVHGGDLILDEKHPKGASFQLSLPLHQD